jgi:hypothetical protein
MRQEIHHRSRPFAALAALAALCAAVAAALIVLGVVLPAEYGIDPSGFGKLTGLNARHRSTPWAA